MMNSSNNSTLLDDEIQCYGDPTYHDHFVAKAALGILYGLVFMTAVCGNTLVIYVVASNKSMQSVTNLFITNLAVSDIVVNFTSLWLTPVYSYLGRWVWGSVMCHLVPLFQGMSTFISALTLMAIAVDRYVAILYPFRTRTSLIVCGTIVVSIWFTGLLLVMPLAVKMNLHYYPECEFYVCREEWTDSFPEMRVVYGFVVLSLQFGIPFVVIAYCYIRIWIHLMYRRSMVVSTSRSASDERRRRRLLKMLVAMVVIYLLAWLPVNALNVLRDATTLDHQEYFVILFLFAHLSSMSASCWNPIVYAWMNDNFRREFKAVLPCFTNFERLHSRSFSVTTGGGGGRKSLATTLANSPSAAYSANRPSVAISCDSPSSICARKLSHTSKNESSELKQEAVPPEHEILVKQVTPTTKVIQKNFFNKRANSETFVSPTHRSATSTILALLTTPTRSKSTTRLVTRKPTGKRIRSSSKSNGDTTNSFKFSSPRRVALTRTQKSVSASNGGQNDDQERVLLDDDNIANQAQLGLAGTGVTKERVDLIDSVQTSL